MEATVIVDMENTAAAASRRSSTSWDEAWVTLGRVLTLVILAQAGARRWPSSGQLREPRAPYRSSCTCALLLGRDPAGRPAAHGR
ncbi:hypothetical protein QJS66_02925 [Kocuria rhizophila]|nr:hypothetical protein QJS66_02925 [Kocuria rhizophila]